MNCEYNYNAEGTIHLTYVRVIQEPLFLNIRFGFDWWILYVAHIAYNTTIICRIQQQWIW